MRTAIWLVLVIMADGTETVFLSDFIIKFYNVHGHIQKWHGTISVLSHCIYLCLTKGSQMSQLLKFRISRMDTIIFT